MYNLIGGIMIESNLSDGEVKLRKLEDDEKDYRLLEK